MFRPTRRPSSSLKCSKRINIACVWRMLRSHHRAYKLYMRHKLRVSRYGGGRALVCGILRGCHLPRALPLLSLPHNNARPPPYLLTHSLCLIYSVDKKNQLDVTFCSLYFSSNSCSTCFGQPCAMCRFTNPSMDALPANRT